MGSKHDGPASLHPGCIHSCCCQIPLPHTSGRIVSTLHFSDHTMIDVMRETSRCMTCLHAPGDASPNWFAMWTLACRKCTCAVDMRAPWNSCTAGAHSWGLEPLSACSHIRLHKALPNMPLDRAAGDARAASLRSVADLIVFLRAMHLEDWPHLCSDNQVGT